MALFLFTRAILRNEPIDVYNHGKMLRDFTYIDDIVEGIFRTSEQIAEPNDQWSGARPDPATSLAPYRVYNIGNNQPVELGRFIDTIEECLGRKAVRNLMPIQPGDVPQTYANIDALETAVGFRPQTTIESGVSRFVDWYRRYYSE
jgi:UDP-glucuronate 4-epimerase